MFQSMAFNNCADIPILFMLLILCSLYAFRKDISIFYRNYSFLIIYMIHLVLSIKIINEVLIKIDFANQFFINNKDNKIVKANQIIFGGLYDSNFTEEDRIKIEKARFWQYVNMLICFVCC
jgi:hypothetical protein